MKKSWNRVLALLCVLALCVGLVPAALAARPMGDEAVEAEPAAAAGSVPGGNRSPFEPAELMDTHTVWVVGDSTACHYGDTEDAGHFYKRMGYGDQVGTYLASGYTVRNLALSGRSSKSFLEEANYATLTGASGMKEGDILIIGWGHNDEKNDDAARFTDASKAYTVEGSFGYSINENYIKPAKAKGVKVILCTPIVRLPSGSSFGANDLHDCTSKGIGNYAQAAKDLGAAVNVPVVDLTTLTKDKWTEMGLTYETYSVDKENAALATTKNNGAYSLHAWSQAHPQYADHTHINSYGAKWVAYLMADAIVNGNLANSDDVKSAFSLTAGAPTAADLTAAATANWEWPTYAAPKLPDDKSKVWPNYEVTNEKGDKVTFYGSAFGSLAATVDAEGKIKSTFNIEPKGDKMHLAFISQKGKVTSGEEGFLMYFYPVPADKTFTLSARVKLNGFASNGTNPNQAAFGLMARDAIWIDQSNDKALMSDYVVAGTLGDGGPNCFRRKAGTLETNIATLKNETVEAGKSYDLSIVGNGDGYTCTFGSETPQSGGYDYKLTTVDGEYVYVGMMASRSVDVTYDNIYLEVDGEVILDTRSSAAFEVEKWTFKDAGGAEIAAGKPAKGGTLDSVDLNIAEQGENEIAVVAIYNADHKMTGIKVVPLKDLQPGKVDLGLPMNPGDTAKIIRLDAKATLRPVDDEPIVLETEPEPEPNPDPDPDPEPVDGKRLVVYDIAGKAESDTSKYTNMITPKAWSTATLEGDATKKLGNDGSMPNGKGWIRFGNLGIHSEKAADKLQSSVTSPDWGTIKPAANGFANTYPDGYVSAGGYVSSGASKATQRDLELANVKAGEVIMLYFTGNSSAGAMNIVNPSKKVVGTASIESKKYGVVTAVADEDGTYAIYGDGALKPVFQRVVVVPTVTVSGKVSLPAGASYGSGWTLKFVNRDKKMEYSASVSATDGTYTVELPATVELTAQLSGAGGLGLKAGDGKVHTFTALDAAGTQTWNLEAVAQTALTVTGTISGFDANYAHLDDLELVFKASESSGQDDVVATLTPNAAAGTVAYTARLISQVEYTPTITGSYDYELAAASAATFSVDTDGTKDLTVRKVAVYNVSGSFLLLDVDDQFAPLNEDSEYANLPDNTVTALKLKNVDDGYEYDANVTAKGYTASLRDGAYEVVATVASGGYTTKGHVVVEGGTATKGVLFKAPADTSAVTLATTVYVDPKNVIDDKGSAPSFKTVTGALAYIGRMTRNSSAPERVTVKIAPGTYREQINVSIPNITFSAANPARETKLTWYYGIGYKYYSANFKGSTDSWYDPELAFDRYAMSDNDVARWGCTVRQTGNGTGFRAENITFENSFNYYLTEEELLDGVQPTSKSGQKVREYGVDVTKKTQTERAAVFYSALSNADQDKAGTAEFKNCKLMSSQDTVITGGKMYFKDCFIEGMTDYICGPGNAVFDTCQLNWKGYPDVAGGGYITAPQTTSPNDSKDLSKGVRYPDEVGYLFRNCYVSQENNLMKGAGSWCRMWAGGNTAVTFLNTVLQSANIIQDEPWNDMGNGVAPSAATGLHEYGTKLPNGTAVAPKGPASTKMTEAQANAVKVSDYFGNWTPFYYIAEGSGTTVTATGLTVSTNGDANIPKYGNTLTVSYTLGSAGDTANDISVIKWYRVATIENTDEATKDDMPKVIDPSATPELIVTTAANVSKTYKTVEADADHVIKVEVTPKTMGGKTGAAVSGTLAQFIRNEFYDPSGSGSVNLGDGINLFLAGDSTVKDYSPAGMYEKNVGENLGSWGEWFQAYFGEGVTVANYANGGRSTRNFINEGSLDKIAKGPNGDGENAMGKGDYLFIQFGHNDSSNTADSDYRASRYAPLGKPATTGYTKPAGAPDGIYAKGKYPVKVNATALAAKTMNWFDATYKGLLLEYVKVALKAGGTPVLVTPVARQYYNTDGTIKPHHDESMDASADAHYVAMDYTGALVDYDYSAWVTNNSKSNEYCAAVEQLYYELKAGEYADALTAAGIDPDDVQKVLFLDAYGLTEKLFTDAWADAVADGATTEDAKKAYGLQLMGTGGDSTHCNKLGGLIEAGIIAQAIQNMDLDISPVVKAPAQVQGKTCVKAGEVPAGQPVFSVNGASKLTAYDVLHDYGQRATHWETFGDAMFQAIATKADQLNPATP